MDLQESEKTVLEHWKSNGIEEKVRAKGHGKKKFYFLDGPPYVTGDLHPGHIWVKTLKDAFVRYKRFRGFEVVDKAGYDVHGLPIENKVEKELGISSKKEIEAKIGIERFTAECRKYVDRYMGRMDADFLRYGISLDFAHPYLPYSPTYMETAWGVFKRISDRNLLYEGKKTLIYCPHCETPLSQGSMEVEYRDEQDPSIYLLFKIDNRASKPRIQINENNYLAVWTTTPWTIPANVAIAANPREIYVEVKFEDRHIILAKARMDSFAAILDASMVVVREFTGADLEGIKYRSPIESKVPKQRELRRYHRVVFSQEMVSMQEGTGLVHIAPGSGVDDYSLGVKNKLPIFCPVGPDAKYTDEAGDYSGIAVPGDANRIVLDGLAESGSLLHAGTAVHSYPHCWRCSNKLIFLATKQWFFNIQRIKKRMVKANEKVSWHPEQVRQWQNSILENSPDWCVSRQRYWGIPMPVWICGNCGDRTVIGSLKELEGAAKNPEYVRNMKDLHRPHIDAVTISCKCGGEKKRILDVLDVWFDSSIAFRASLTEEQFDAFMAPELIVEYIEQIRGWFQYMLKIGLLAYGKNPLRNVLVHGIMAGNDGRKMSKSFGNYRPLGDLAAFATADAFRLWSLDHDPILNRNLNDSEIKESESAVNILHNIANLIEESRKASGCVWTDAAPKPADDSDRWIISRLESMVASVTESMERYEVGPAAERMRRFVVEDLSRFYLKTAKKRMADGGSAAKKTLGVIDYVMFRTAVVASPIIPFVSEGIYLKLYKRTESIFLEDWPKARTRSIDKGLEDEFEIAKEIIGAVLNNREKKNVKLRAPILSATVETNSDKIMDIVGHRSDTIASYVNAKQVVAKKADIGNDKEVKPVFSELGPAFKQSARVVAEALKSVKGTELESEMDKTGRYVLHTQSGNFEILPGHVVVVERKGESDATRFSHGLVRIDATQTDELKMELLFREITRRIQMMRKEAGLTRADTVDVRISAEPDIAAVLKPMEKKIAKSVKALNVAVDSSAEGGAGGKDWELLDTRVTISVSRVAAPD